MKLFNILIFAFLAIAHTTYGQSIDEVMLKKLQTAFSKSSAKVAICDAKKMGIMATSGNFVLTLKDGHEVGLFIDSQSWTLSESPYFWIRLKANEDVLGYKQVTITPTEDGFFHSFVPNDWMISDYRKLVGTNRKPMLPAGNLNVEMTAEKLQYRLSGGFIPNASLMVNALSEISLIMKSDNKTVQMFNIGINHAQNEKHASEILATVSKLVASP